MTGPDGRYGQTPQQPQWQAGPPDPYSAAGQSPGGGPYSAGGQHSAGGLYSTGGQYPAGQIP